MRIKDVLKMDSDVKGLKVQGVVSYMKDVVTHPAKGEKGSWTSQFIVIKDGEDSIGVSLNNITMDKSFKGKEVELSNCTTGTYEDNEGNTKMSLRSNGSYVIVGQEQKPPVSQKTPEKTPSGPDWDLINLRKERTMCVAYSKDLAVAGKIGVDEILNQAERLVRYIGKGIPDNTPEQDAQVETDFDSEIPF